MKEFIFGISVIDKVNFISVLIKNISGITSKIFEPSVLVRSIIVPALIASSLSACNGTLQGAPDRLITKSEELKFLKNSYGLNRISQYHADSGAQKRSIRNSIVLGRIYAIDIAYSEFEKSLTQERQKVPFIATVTSIALSGTGSLIGSSATKSILAAVDTALKGTKESYDKEILVQKTIDVLQQTMRAQRNKIRTEIVGRLTKTVQEYPLELALGDIEEYYTAGTITGGLIGLTEKTAVALATSKALKISTVSTFGSDNATELIRNYWKSGGASASTRLNNWLTRENVPVPISIFIRSKEYADHRAKLVLEFGL